MLMQDRVRFVVYPPYPCRASGYFSAKESSFLSSPVACRVSSPQTGATQARRPVRSKNNAMMGSAVSTKPANKPRSGHHFAVTRRPRKRVEQVFAFRRHEYSKVSAFGFHRPKPVGVSALKSIYAECRSNSGAVIAPLI
jgi:hypothetical protein